MVYSADICEGPHPLEGARAACWFSINWHSSPVKLKTRLRTGRVIDLQFESRPVLQLSLSNWGLIQLKADFVSSLINSSFAAYWDLKSVDGTVKDVSVAVLCWAD